MERRKRDAVAGAIALLFIAASPSAPPPAIEFMSAGELKAKIAAGQPVTIVDVRDSNGYAGSPDKIKGAIHVRLRRLKQRLTQQPLSGLPRDQQVVTYCACPADEAGIRAAQVFVDAGFQRVRTLKGGWQAWREVGGPIERTAKP